MWALLNDKKIVIACITPDKTEEEAIQIANGMEIIRMTLENTPAYIGAVYRDGKFYLEGENNNG